MPRIWTEEQKKNLSITLQSVWTDEKRKQASERWTKAMRKERSKYIKKIRNTDRIRVCAGLTQLTNYKVIPQRKLILISDDDIERWKQNEEANE